jgi:hypothetical protein
MILSLWGRVPAESAESVSCQRADSTLAPNAGVAWNRGCCPARCFRAGCSVPGVYPRYQVPWIMAQIGSETVSAGQCPYSLPGVPDQPFPPASRSHVSTGQSRYWHLRAYSYLWLGYTDRLGELFDIAPA